MHLVNFRHFYLQLFTVQLTTLRGYLRKSLGNVSVVVRENVSLRSVHKAATRIRDSAIHSASVRIFSIQTLRTRDSLLKNIQPCYSDNIDLQ